MKMKHLRSLLFILFMITILIPEQGLSYKNKVVRKKTRTTVAYNIPDVTLINQDGEEVNFKSFLNSDKLVILDFVFATCPTICPILSAGMASFQKKIGPNSEKVQLVTLTIDPEYDTPEVLKEYSRNYYAQEGWDFFTGSKKDIDRVMKAFDAYVADKMDHLPLTFLHMPGSENWIRINGLMSTSELMQEYKELMNEYM